MTEIKEDNSLDVITDDDHSLLEAPLPAYSNTTIRRAFIVWIYCGQQNKFEDVCKYYHRLEAWEETLPAEQRVQSRHHELDLFTNPPPTSEYQKELFPKLYTQSHVTESHIKLFEKILNEPCVFKLEGFNEILHQNKTTTDEVTNTSKNIRKHCKSRLLTLRRFLDNFIGYTIKCELNKTIDIVENYLKKKSVEAELDIVQNYPSTFDFLETETAVSDEHEVNNNVIDTSEAIEDNNIKVALLKQKPSKKAELNDSCAAFFKSFNAKYIKKSWNLDKTVSCLPLTDFNRFVRKERKKSRSAESLIQDKANTESLSLDFFSHFMKASEKNNNMRIKVAL